MAALATMSYPWLHKTLHSHHLLSKKLRNTDPRDSIEYFIFRFHRMTAFRQEDVPDCLIL